MPNNAVVHWMPEPGGRGTVGLIISCLATSFLCVYATLRLNVPPKCTGRGRMILHKLGWVLAGMFLPELVISTAWIQRMSAVELKTKIEQRLRNQTGSNGVKWTMAHSFYAQMGGFVFETDDPGKDAYIPGSPALHLTANGVEILARMGHLPSLPKESILDKSKDDGLGNSIVVLQVGWFILQCIARSEANLPFTLLEVNTVAHILCTFVTYLLWWDKPHDIHDPTIIRGLSYRHIVAAMWMFSHTSIRYNPLGGSVYSPEIESLLQIKKEHMRLPLPIYSSTQAPGTANDVVVDMQPADHPKPQGAEPGRASVNPRSLIKISPSGTEILSLRRDIEIRLLKGEFLLPFGFGPKLSSNRFKSRPLPGFGLARPSPSEIVIDYMTLTRWRLAQECMNKYPGIWNQYKKETNPTDKKSRTLFEYPSALCDDSFVDAVMANWPGPAPMSMWYSHMGGFFLLLKAYLLVYGGLHLAARNYYFPSSDERLLWICSSAGIMICWILYLFVAFFGYRVSKILNKSKIPDQRISTIRTLPDTLLVIVWYAVAFGGVLAYMVARAFISVEVFLSLRDLPVAAYQTPKWSQYLRHL